MERPEIVNFIISTIQDILERENLTAPPVISEETAIFGQDGLLTSLMLVELMLALEDFCAENGRGFVWANDSAMSEKRSAYRTVASLTDFIISLPLVAKPGDV